VSLPLVDRRDGRIYGVLTGQVWVKDLHSRLAAVGMRDGFVVLFNERGQCLLHRSEAAIKPRPDQPPVDWRPKCELYREALAEDGDGLADYVDPIDGKHYLASYSRFRLEEGRRGVHWLVLCQHDQAAVLGGFKDITTALGVTVLLVLGPGVLLLIAAWGWLLFSQLPGSGEPHRARFVQRVARSAVYCCFPAVIPCLGMLPASLAVFLGLAAWLMARGDLAKMQAHLMEPPGALVTTRVAQWQAACAALVGAGFLILWGLFLMLSARAASIPS
jgi:hypothetical protein